MRRCLSFFKCSSALLIVFIFINSHAMLQDEAVGEESVKGRKLNLLMDLIAPHWSLFAKELGEQSEEINLLSGHVTKKWERSYLNFTTDILKSRRMLQNWEAYQKSVDTEKLINILKKIGKHDLANIYQQRLCINKIREPTSEIAKLAISDVAKIQLSSETEKELSKEIGGDWFKFGMLLDLPFFDVENIIHGHAVNNLKYNANGEPVKTLEDSYKKCKAILRLWAREGNTSKKIISQALVDINREDLVGLIYPKSFIRQEAINPIQAERPSTQSVSSEELKTLATKISPFWTSFIALLGVPEVDIKGLKSNQSRLNPDELAYNGLCLAKKTGVLDNVDISFLEDMADNASLQQDEPSTLKEALAKFLVATNPEDQIQCHFCLDPPNVVPECGHACCAICLLKNEQNYGRSACAMCAKEIDPKKIRPLRS